ncbi:MAG: hypothetical protein ACYTGC_10085 [Planctomycetota bacterium]
MILRSNRTCCRGSWKAIVGACAVALLTIGAALADDGLGELFQQYAPVIIVTIGVICVLTSGCVLRRCGRGNSKSESKIPPSDERDRELSDWPSA